MHNLVHHGLALYLQFFRLHVSRHVMPLKQHVNNIAGKEGLGRNIYLHHLPHRTNLHGRIPMEPHARDHLLSHMKNSSARKINVNQQLPDNPRPIPPHIPTIIRRTLKRPKSSSWQHSILPSQVSGLKDSSCIIPPPNQKVKLFFIPLPPLRINPLRTITLFSFNLSIFNLSIF